MLVCMCVHVCTCVCLLKSSPEGWRQELWHCPYVQQFTMGCETSDMRIKSPRALAICSPIHSLVSFPSWVRCGITA